ncbi:MAG TPA: VCBS repeat-containing protein, partial [Gemmata sp.]|nr:VCBS repeat-containing protein [Gemmata sp.]
MPSSPRRCVHLQAELLEDRITPTISFTHGSDSFNLGEYPDSLAAGDLGNGSQDFVVGDQSDGVEIFMNDGSGNFTMSGTVNPGFGVDGLKLVDLTGNGTLDLVGFGSGKQFFVALGNGDGTFQTPIVTNVGQSIQSMDVGDLNGDGKPDLVLGIGRSVAVFVNNGTASVFGSPTYYFWSQQPNAVSSAIVIGDFNGDGKPDLAVADYTGDAIQILLNQGNGTFGTPTQINNPIQSPTGSLLAGDFNNDGNLDLVESYVGTNEIGLLLGNGNGTFQPATVVDTRSEAFNQPASMVAAD